MNNKIVVLQTMRLFAALSVFQYHLWNNYLGIRFLSPDTDLFFILIGMVAAIAQTHYITSGKWAKYISARYLRLYVTFIPIFIIYLLVGRDELNLPFVLKSFFFIPIKDHLPLVGPTWMLTQFLLFYWLFSISILFKQEKLLIPIFGLWALGCLLVSRTDLFSSIPKEWQSTLFDTRNLEFILGYLAGKFILQRRISPKIAPIVTIASLVALLAAILWINLVHKTLANDIRLIAFGLPLTFMVIGLVSLEQHNNQNPLFRIFLHPVLVWFGSASYVLYLIHNMILRIWDTILPIQPIHVPFIILIVLGATALIYQFWEKPVTAFLQEKLFKPKTTQA